MAHGLTNVLDTADLLRDQAEITFLFVGAGAERETLMRESERRSQTNVLFLPAQPKDRVPDIWSLCDVALVHLKDSPAFADVLPSKIFEAMAMGLPLILVSPEGEASDLILEKGVGEWVPAGDPERFAYTVRTLSENNPKCKSLAHSSLDAAQMHTREKQAREMLEVFKWSLDQ